ncbi:MAG TPA: DUF1501 domain-containing protein [Planctomycetaceae bacterium]|nr:DUF1501 domain-containing protein [Planctomycetaceae bacterium]
MSLPVLPPAGLSRRTWLRQAGNGFGALALAGMLTKDSTSPAGEPIASTRTHHPPRATSVIWLFMNGGPSQIDTWDYKPELARRDGQELAGLDPTTGFFPAAIGPVMRSPFSFRKYGECGHWASELFPCLAQHVDEMAFLPACWAESNNHSPALFQMNSGFTRQGLPCFGAWATYGLGDLNHNLPSFVVMTDPWKRGLPKGHGQNWTAGFLPASAQGTVISNDGPLMPFLQSPHETVGVNHRDKVDLLADLNREYAVHSGFQDRMTERLATFELAMRMQSALPEVSDLATETAATQALYGLNDERCAPFGRQCLIARRLVEQGVRCIQIYSGGTENEQSWDGHQNIEVNHRRFAGETDRPIAGLLADLKQRGLLDSTLVICNGEFGRLPIVQRGGSGRDHNPHAFTTWLAGGGIRGGVTFGQTDELGFRGIENRVSIPDLHATLLWQLGLDHERLTYRHHGRDFRLTDVAGRVIREIL